MHELFQRQTAEMLEAADLSEEAKQSILIAMNCPCCGAGALSFTVKLKAAAGTRPAPRFFADGGGKG